jgi:hypothetical protein
MPPNINQLLKEFVLRAQRTKGGTPTTRLGSQTKQPLPEAVEDITTEQARSGGAAQPAVVAPTSDVIPVTGGVSGELTPINAGAPPGGGVGAGGDRLLLEQAAEALGADPQVMERLGVNPQKISAFQAGPGPGALNEAGGAKTAATDESFRGKTFYEGEQVREGRNRKGEIVERGRDVEGFDAVRARLEIEQPRLTPKELDEQAEIITNENFGEASVPRRDFRGATVSQRAKVRKGRREAIERGDPKYSPQGNRPNLEAGPEQVFSETSPTPQLDEFRPVRQSSDTTPVEAQQIEDVENFATSGSILRDKPHKFKRPGGPRAAQNITVRRFEEGESGLTGKEDSSIAKLDAASEAVSKKEDIASESARRFDESFEGNQLETAIKEADIEAGGPVSQVQRQAPDQNLEGQLNLFGDNIEGAEHIIRDMMAKHGIDELDAPAKEFGSVKDPLTGEIIPDRPANYVIRDFTRKELVSRKISKFFDELDPLLKDLKASMPENSSQTDRASIKRLTDFRRRLSDLAAEARDERDFSEIQTLIDDFTGPTGKFVSPSGEVKANIVGRQISPERAQGTLPGILPEDKRIPIVRDAEGNVIGEKGIPDDAVSEEALAGELFTRSPIQLSRARTGQVHPGPVPPIGPPQQFVPPQVTNIPGQPTAAGIPARTMEEELELARESLRFSGRGRGLTDKALQQQNEILNRVFDPAATTRLNLGPALPAGDLKIRIPATRK